MRRISIVNETDLSAGDVLWRISSSWQVYYQEIQQGDFFVSHLHDCLVTRELSKAGNLRVRVVERREDN